MAGTKISELPSASTLTGSEVIPVVQSGATKQALVTALPYVPTGTGAVTTTIESKLRENVSLKDFGAVGDGVTNDATAVINALATGKTVFGETGKTYKINSPITINLGLQSFDGQGCKLDFSALTGTQVAVTIANSNALTPGDLSSPIAEINNIRNVAILGPGKAGVGAAYSSTVTGIYAAVPHISLFNVMVYGFGYGIDIFTNGYVHSYDKTAVGQCAIGVRIISGGANYGERISFVNSVIYDNALGIKNDCQSGALQFTNCSIDYNVLQLTSSNSGVTELHSTWFEANDAGAGNAHIALTGSATFTMIGGRVQLNGSVGALAQAGLLNTSSNSSANFENVFMFNTKNTANVLDAGSGFVELAKTKSYSVSYIPSKISNSNNNKLYDGGFEQASISDMWYLAADTAAITNRFTGANVSIALSSTFAKTGTQSLKMTKTTAGGAGAFSVMVFAPSITRAAFSGWYRKPAGVSSGAIFVTTSIARVDGILSSGVPNILYSQTLDTISIAGTTSLIDWTEISSGMDRSTTAATNCFIITFNAQPYSGDLYLDDFNISFM
jgi:hypothetical protein